MTRSNVEVAHAARLLAAGRTDRQISEATGVPRSTVRDWRAGRLPRRDTRDAERITTVKPGEPKRAAAYAYLLGMYLGDGYISQGPRTQRLRITLDSAYPGIISESIFALTAVVPGRRASSRKRPDSGCVDVSMYFAHWTALFPQHGSGPKHSRPIRLAAWQQAVVEKHQAQFVRGLLHSDGCRVRVLDRGNPSVRYHFSNRSEDIKALYCSSLDALGVRWTRPSARDIAVYRKASTALLDSVVGPKR